MASDGSLRGLRALAEYYSKALTTVREWAEKGCPYTKDGNVYLFDIAEVDDWLSKRSDRITDDALLSEVSGDDREELLKARVKKIKLEADALQRTKERDEGLYGPVADFEAATVKLLSQMKQIMSEQFNELLDLSDLSPAEKEKLQAKLTKGFNEIADLDQPWTT